MNRLSGWPTGGNYILSIIINMYELNSSVDSTTMNGNNIPAAASDESANNMQPFPQKEAMGNGSSSSVSEVSPTDEYFCHLCSLESEMPHTACPDPLLIEMETIEKAIKEAHNIHDQKLLQLKSEHEKEVNKLKEKYRMLTQNLNHAVEVQKKELDTYVTALKNESVTKVLTHNHHRWKGDAVQCTEQVARASSSRAHVSRHHIPPRTAAQRHEQCMGGPPSYTSVEGVNTSRLTPVRPPLGTSAATSSYSTPLRPHQSSGIPEQGQLPPR